MSDFLSDVSKPQAGDRKQPNPSASGQFQPSDIPGFVNPVGQPTVYLQAEKPQAGTFTRDQAMMMAQQGGGAKSLYPNQA